EIYRADANTSSRVCKYLRENFSRSHAPVWNSCSSFYSFLLLAHLEGFEPPPTVLETVVLPLHQRCIKQKSPLCTAGFVGYGRSTKEHHTAEEIPAACHQCLLIVFFIVKTKIRWNFREIQMLAEDCSDFRRFLSVEW